MKVIKILSGLRRRPVSPAHRRRMERLRALDGDRCFYCGTLMRFPWEPANNCQRASVEHLIDKSRGGTLMVENTVLAHERCNSSRGQIKTLGEKLATRAIQAPPLPYRVIILLRHEEEMLAEMRAHREAVGVVPLGGWKHP